MTRPPSDWEINYAKLCILRDICQDPSAALFVVAFLCAELDPDRVDHVVKAAQEWVAGNPPLAAVRSIYDDRD